MGYLFPFQNTSNVSGYHYDTMYDFGNCTYLTTWTLKPVVVRKNWRWFDVFRLWLSRIPAGFIPACPMMPLAFAHVTTAPSVAQMRRQKRKLDLQRSRVS